MVETEVKERNNIHNIQIWWVRSLNVDLTIWSHNYEKVHFSPLKIIFGRLSFCFWFVWLLLFLYRKLRMMSVRSWQDWTLRELELLHTRSHTNTGSDNCFLFSKISEPELKTSKPRSLTKLTLDPARTQNEEPFKPFKYREIFYMVFIWKHYKRETGWIKYELLM